jgi:hypothetical protein
VICEECAGVVLTVAQERNPVVVTVTVEGKSQTTYTKRVCDSCAREILERTGTRERRMSK